MKIKIKSNTRQKIDSYSRREVKRVSKIILKIEKFKNEIKKISDEELKNKTKEFRERLKSGATLDSLLPEAFAVVSEADRRVLGKEPYKVQLIGGILLHQGRIAELKTGEGKTLLSTLPAYLNALTGEGVHIITVNEYLAKRDSDEMKQVHEFLGLSVGCVLSQMNGEERKREYQCDITYITNSEIGFDYLRDNMAFNKNDRVQRGLVYSIIDEIDSVLIDEARTPLIISGMGDNNSLFYGTCDILAKRLVKGSASGEFSKIESILGAKIKESGDFIVDEKDKVITLTEEGIEKCERFLHLENLASPKHLREHHGILNALHANYLMKKDVDYVVKNGEVLIIDAFTGRIMDGRRYEDELHQALEAKERVKIKENSKTLATITYQNFFNKYKKKSGMTGTGKTEEKEFREVYSLDVVEVPTNLPLIRQDLPDLIFKTEKEKFLAICDSVEILYNRHQPVLVGVSSVENSEKLSRMLSQRGLPHSVLNAKNDALEAEIVSRAGGLGRVTIATNMAGRGTDIKVCDEAKSLGGLVVLGTEKHESIRIDNQLRGRSGRQGDIGMSQFYVSLEDEIIKNSFPEKIEKLKELSSAQLLESKKVRKLIREAQLKVEQNFSSMRKRVFEFDIVNNDQREDLYDLRDSLLNEKDLNGFYVAAVNNFFGNLKLNKEKRNDSEKTSEKITIDYLKHEEIIAYSKLVCSNTAFMDSKLLSDIVITAIAKSREVLFKDDLDHDAEIKMILSTIDHHWQIHLERLEYLRQWIDISSYGQKDPRFEYKNRASEMYSDMLNSISYTIIKKILKTNFKGEKNE